jgi:sulfite reductase alpha subunit-like flavoprotein
LPKNSLSSLNFTVFGLGDSSYELFNAMAKKLTQRLIDLGANLVHKIGLGDQQHEFGYQTEFDPWLDAFWPQLGKVVGGKSSSMNKNMG